MCVYVYFPTKNLNENCSFIFIQRSNCQHILPPRFLSCPHLGTASRQLIWSLRSNGPEEFEPSKLLYLLLTVCHREKWWLHIIYQKIRVSSYLGQSKIAFGTVFPASNGFRNCPEFQLVVILTAKKGWFSECGAGCAMIQLWGLHLHWVDFSVKPLPLNHLLLPVGHLSPLLLWVTAPETQWFTHLDLGGVIS